MIPVAEPKLGEKELEYVIDCVKNGWISSIGKYVTQFEEGFSKFCGMKYGIATSNGTTALHLALVTLGIGPGDEVIVPTLTFVATANAVTYTSARPVFVDSEEGTWNIDPEKVEEKITERTKAIIPVHLYGHPADMDPIIEIARRHGLFIIEDAAEAHGAWYKGRCVGSMGDMACFSFYGNKIITTGEGGMVLTNDERFRDKARMLRDHGMSKERRYWHPLIGYNYRMTNIQAAIGVAQLENIEAIIACKQRIAALYDSLLRGVKRITLPPEATWAQNVCWMYSILIEDTFGLSRDALMLRLRERDIDSRPFFNPVHTMPPYQSQERFPVAESLARKGINLPSAPTLTEDQVKYICQVLQS